MYMHKIQSKLTMQYQQCALLQDPSAHCFVKTNKQINSAQYKISRITEKLNPMQLKFNGDTGENYVNMLNKMAAISQTTPCSIRIHFTLGQHWLVYWSGAILARNHHANQLWHIVWFYL